MAKILFNQIVINLFKSLPTFNNKYQYILVCIDVHIRYVLLRAFYFKATKKVAEALLKIFVDFGLLKIFQSDNYE
jgi:hypothetical protein